MVKARVLIAITLLFTAFASTASMQTARGRGILAGEIRGNSGESVANGKVKLMMKTSDALEATSDKDGRWRIMGIAKGEWTMLVTAPGYAARVVKLVVERESDSSDAVVTVMRKISVTPRTN